MSFEIGAPGMIGDNTLIFRTWSLVLLAIADAFHFYSCLRNEKTLYILLKKVIFPPYLL